MRVPGYRTYAIRIEVLNLVPDRSRHAQASRGQSSQYLNILVDLGDFGQIPGPSSSLFWRVRVLLRGAFLCIRRLTGGGAS
jgi:hypothetical protein